MFQKTSYHEAIESAIIANNNNLLVKAGPGSGKTTTGANVIVPSLVQKNGPNGGAIVFNKRNQTDMAGKLARFPEVEVSTVHALCLRLIKFKWEKMRVNAPQKEGYQGFGKYRRYAPAKLGKLRDTIESLYPDLSEPEKGQIEKITNLMKGHALGISGHPDANLDSVRELCDLYGINNNKPEGEVEPLDDSILDAAIEVFGVTVNDKSSVDFGDMLYFVLKYNLAMPQWSWVFVDEAQDMSPAMIEFLSRMSKTGIRVVAVGDPNQGINFFAGALNDSMDRMEERFNASVLPLPVSYRCSKIAAEMANGIFPGSIIPSDTANSGICENIAFEEFVSEEFPDNSLIMARSHKLIFPSAIAYVKAGRKFRYKGIREITVKMEKSLRMAFMRSGKSGDLTAMRQSLLDYQEQKNDNNNSGKVPRWLQELNEVIDCLCDLLISVEKDGGDYDDVIQYLAKLGDAEDSTYGPLFSSIHAAKGAESPNVYIVGPMESPLAKTSGELAAEKCAAYVALTRASDKLTLVSAPGLNS